MCSGHHGQLKSLIRQLEAAPYREQTTFSGSGKWKSVGCITFSNLDAVALAFSGPVVGLLVYLGLSLKNTKAEGSGALCAFYQGTRGGSFSLQRTIDSLKTLSEVGKANPCGSIPINWPHNNDTGGILTMNYVDGAPCDGFCGGSKDNALPGNQALKNDPNHAYAPGQCSTHVTWYAPTKGIMSSYFDVDIRDANKVLIGSEYYVEAKANSPVSVNSNLPTPLQITADSVTTSPLKMMYDGQTWDSTMKQCVCDKAFKDGYKECDCGFPCGQSLGLLNPS